MMFSYIIAWLCLSAFIAANTMLNAVYIVKPVVNNYFTT